MNFKNFSTEDALIFSFFAMYLYGLEKNKEILDLLKAVVFHSDEANTDKDLKIAVKNYMISHPRINVQSNGMFLLDIDGNSIISNLTLLWSSIIGKSSPIHQLYLLTLAK